MTRRRPLVLYAYAIGFLALLYGPVVLLPLFSFNDSSIIAFPLKSLTLRWYKALANDPGLQRALWASLAVALSVSIIATALGGLAAWTLTRYRIGGGRFATGFMLLPLIVPGLVLGVSLLAILASAGVTLSLITVAIGHLVLCLPFALVVMISRFESFDISLEDASRDLGAGPFATFLRVTLPLAMPGLFAALLLTFTISFDEFVVSFFLAGSDPTLPVYIWSQLRFPQKLPLLLALASLILAFSFLLACIAERFRRKAP
jgi:spermidine/putrescine transport system permease protein